MLYPTFVVYHNYPIIFSYLSSLLAHAGLHFRSHISNRARVYLLELLTVSQLSLVSCERAESARFAFLTSITVPEHTIPFSSALRIFNCCNHRDCFLHTLCCSSFYKSPSVCIIRVVCYTVNCIIFIPRLGSCRSASSNWNIPKFASLVQLVEHVEARHFRVH